MNNVVFIVSHLGSGSQRLLIDLNKNPRIQMVDNNAMYRHPDDLLKLLSHKHKLDNAAAIYGDHLLFNASLSYKGFYDICKFIYFIRKPIGALSLMLSAKPTPYSITSAFRYYTFRLQRICQMAKHTPGAVLLTWKEYLRKMGAEQIEDYLRLKEPIEFSNHSANMPYDIPSEVIGEANDCYERHLYYLKQLDLIRP